MRITMTAARAGCVALLAIGLTACSGQSENTSNAAVAAEASAGTASGSIPTLKDLPPGYNMEGGTVLDMRGISLGMPRAEAFAKLKEYFPQETNFGPGGTGLGGTDGQNKVDFDFDQEDRAASKVEGTEDYMTIEYTSPLSGERVMGVSRSLVYGGQQPAFDDVLNGVIAKYGTPTYREEMGTAITLSYAWFEGKLAPPTTAETMKAMEANSLYEDPPANPAWCISTRGMNEFTYNLGYSDKAILDRAPGCTVVLSVHLAKGKRPDLLYLADFYLQDYRRSFDNRVLNSAWLKGEIEKEAAKQGGAAAPTL